MLEPTDVEQETNFWRSFNSQHSVGVDVYKFGGGGGEEENEDGGDEDEGEGRDEDEVSRIHVDVEGKKENGEEKHVDVEGKEENGEEKNKEEARFPDSSHHGQYEVGV